jgi:hypothetical protein
LRTIAAAADSSEIRLDKFVRGMLADFRAVELSGMKDVSGA